MSKVSLLSILLFVFATAMVSDSKVNTYKIITDNSAIEWVGKKVSGQHSGTIAIKSGELKLKGKEISGGSFVMDMTRIKVTDIAESNPQNKKLLVHLENPDFFDVVKYPEAKLVIEKVVKKSDKVFIITGNLTIKDKTNPITFESTISGQTKNTIITRANLKIDRTKYGIVYKSSTLGEAMINDVFDLNIKLVGIK
jgi:polyisoprenoid-binding protein YceI